MEVQAPLAGLLDEPAVAVEVRLVGVLRGDGHAAVQEVHLLLRDELPVADLAVAQVENGPFDEVGRGAADAAGRAHDGQPPERLFVAVHRPDVHLAALALEGVGEGGRSVGQRGAEAFAVEGRFGHAERLEDAGADILFPALARHFFDDLGSGDEGDVVVLVVAAEDVGGRHQFQHMVDVVAGVAQVAQIGADVIAQAGAVRGEVLDLEVFGDPGVVHFKVGEVLLHGVVPADEPLVGQLRQHGRGEGFRHGADLEQGVRVDGNARLETLHTVAFRQDYFSVLVHRNAHARNLPVGHDLGDGPFHVGDDFLLGNGRFSRGNILHGLRPGQRRENRKKSQE